MEARGRKARGRKTRARKATAGRGLTLLMLATTATLQEISQYAVKAHQRHAGLCIRIEGVQCRRRCQSGQRRSKF